MSLCGITESGKPSSPCDSCTWQFRAISSSSLPGGVPSLSVLGRMHFGGAVRGALLQEDTPGGAEISLVGRSRIKVLALQGLWTDPRAFPGHSPVCPVRIPRPIVMQCILRPQLPHLSKRGFMPLLLPGRSSGEAMGEGGELHPRSPLHPFCLECCHRSAGSVG